MGLISIISNLGIEDGVCGRCVEPIICDGPTTCAELATCGPGGADISDADFELVIDGVARGTGDLKCGVGECEVANDTYLSSAPQSGSGCCCLYDSGGTGGGCGFLHIVWTWSICPPGCGGLTDWQIQAVLNIGGPQCSYAFEVFFTLSGAAANSAILTLCAGGEVELPYVSGDLACGPNGKCDGTGATAILRTIYP